MCLIKAARHRVCKADLLRSPPALNFSWVRSLFPGRRRCLFCPTSPGVGAFCPGNGCAEVPASLRLKILLCLCISGLTIFYSQAPFPSAFKTMRGSRGMAPFIPAQSSFGIAAVLPRRRVSHSPTPSRCAPASSAPAPHRAAVPWRAQPQPPPSAGGGSRRFARAVRGGPGVPPPPGRGSAPR